MKRTIATKTKMAKNKGDDRVLALTDAQIDRLAEYFSNRFEEDSEPIALLSGFLEYLVRLAEAKVDTESVMALNNIDDVTFRFRQQLFKNSHAGNVAFYGFNKRVLPTLRQYVEA